MLTYYNGGVIDAKDQILFFTILKEELFNCKIKEWVVSFEVYAKH